MCIVDNFFSSKAKMSVHQPASQPLSNDLKLFLRKIKKQNVDKLIFFNIYYPMETSFLELRCKEVINIVDGRRLGHITDVVFSLPNAYVLGIIVPGGNQSLWNVFKQADSLFIPWQQIIKIGEDSILVEIANNAYQPNNFILGNKKH